MKIKKPSIKVLVFGGLCGFTVLILCLLWLFQTVFLDDFYKSIKKSEIKSVSKKIEAVIDDDNINSEISSVAKTNQVCIIISDASGNIKYSAEGAFGCTLHKLSPNELEQLIVKARSENGKYMCSSDVSFSDINMSGKKNNDQLLKNENIIYVSLINCDGEEYAVMLNCLITPVDATVHTLRIQLIWITVIMLILATAIAFIIMKVITKPIAKINDSAKKLAYGDYSVTFDEKGYREISELGHTLNIAAAELGKTDRFQKEIIANVSHDLRTPLTMIKGYSEAMLDLPDEISEDNIRIIIDETERLSVLVNDMLDLSRLQSEKISYNPTKYNLTESIKNLINRYSRFYSQNGFKIVFESDDDIFVYADEVKISQVIYNLINNAVNYSGKSNTVIVHQLVKNGYVRIEIIDFGVGIEPDELPHIWSRYYRSNDDHKRAVLGTGLGLSIVRKILELHSARYGVNSALNDGSTFWFELPEVQY